jgi:hypothetical protein
MFLMKVPLVKEWGSWVVFGASCLAACAAGFSTQQWQAGRYTLATTIATIAGLLFLINTKPSLAASIRTRGTQRGHIAWFTLFTAAGLLLLVPFLRTGIEKFAPFLILAMSYGVFLWRGKEHHVFAELNGFALLTASAPVVYFVITGTLSMTLYTAVFLFFAAGVLKVRVRIRKSLFYRVLMIAYCAVTLIIFFVLRIHLILLAPLAENIISALWLRDEKLKTTGNIELAKSILFVILVGIFWEW